MQLQSHTVTDERGVERCRVIKETAIPNVANDPSKGYHQAKAYCNQPMMLNIAERRKVCPSCYKEPVVGNPQPRVTNAAGVVLTVKELEECGLNPDGTRIDGKEIAVTKTTEAPVGPQTLEAKVEIKKDEVTITVTLADIESGADIAALLIKRVSEGMDKLPVSNFGESKRLIRLQEKLEALLGA